MSSVWIPLGAAMLDWLALALQRERLQSFTKPAVMLAVLVWILLDSPGLTTPIAFFFTAVVFSLVGDVLLLPALDHFLPALIPFAVAHLFYIIGLNIPLPPFNASTLLFAGVVALLALRIFARIRSARTQSGDDRQQIPLGIYAVILSVMLFSGLATLANDAWPPAAALPAAAGAVLFALSDIMLVWNRFIAPISRARLKTRATYHFGQILLVAGAIAHFS